MKRWETFKLVAYRPFWIFAYYCKFACEWLGEIIIVTLRVFWILILAIALAIIVQWG